MSAQLWWWILILVWCYFRVALFWDGGMDVGCWRGLENQRLVACTADNRRKRLHFLFVFFFVCFYLNQCRGSRHKHNNQNKNLLHFYDFFLFNNTKVRPQYLALTKLYHPIQSLHHLCNIQIYYKHNVYIIHTHILLVCRFVCIILSRKNVQLITGESYKLCRCIFGSLKVCVLYFLGERNLH